MINFDSPPRTTMAIRSNSTRVRRNGVSRWSLALRCFLLFVAWQGPIPWCHCHGTLANTPGGVSPWLSQHLKSHHPSVAPLSNLFFGWHLHVYDPESSTDDENDPSKRSRERQPITNSADCLSESAIRAAARTSEFAAPQLDLQLGRMAIALRPESQCSAHFFDGFAPSLPLPLRFCVSRS